MHVLPAIAADEDKGVRVSTDQMANSYVTGGCCCQGIHFSVVLTEGRPDGTGRSMARELEKFRVPTVVILDSGVAYALEALK